MLLQEALDVARQHSDKSGMAQSLYPLAIVTKAAGDDEKAGGCITRPWSSTAKWATSRE